MGLKSLFDTKNPWYLIGTILIDNKRFQEAKELYMRLLSEYDDKDEKYECYRSLLGIAIAQDDQIEIQNIDRKMTEIKFGFVLPDLNSCCKSMNREEIDNFYATFEHIKKMCSLMSMTRPINELLSLMQSDEFRTDIKQLQDSLYPVAKVLIKCGEYDQVIIILEYMLKLINMSSDSLQIIRCYIQLGYCYRELKLYDKALKYYNLTLEQRVQLSIDEQS
jgi:tetratricopeptide (TPR) repeat protein